MTWQSVVLKPALPKEVFHQGGKTLVGVFKVQATQLVVKTRCTATHEELRTTLLEAAFVGTAGSVFAFRQLSFGLCMLAQECPSFDLK